MVKVSLCSLIDINDEYMAVGTSLSYLLPADVTRQVSTTRLSWTYTAEILVLSAASAETPSGMPDSCLLPLSTPPLPTLLYYCLRNTLAGDEAR